MKFTDDRACHVSELARYSMPINRPADRFRDNQPDQRCSIRRLVGEAMSVHNNSRLRGSNTAPHCETELRRPSHPVFGRQHCAFPWFQAVRVPRPLRRRAVTIALPARVRMRRRKPWTLARRRLFGWNVRLPLATTFSPHHDWQPRPGGAEAHSRINELPLSKTCSYRRGFG